MFSFHAVNTAEVNAGSRPPDAAVLTIIAGEDSNQLSWTSPYFTDFFYIYWSDKPFTSIDETGVNVITASSTGSFAPGADPSVIINYTHNVPAAYGLSVLYYRISAYNRNGWTLSNQVDNYNFRLAIYQEIYNKTIEDLTLRFTPEIRRQYEDSILWRSFVQSLCSELATGRFEIKEAVKQMNLQKAVDVFLNLWNSITGISKINVLNATTGEMEPETDAQYRQRLVDNIFWDKISNIALKKTLMLKLGYDADVLDEGQDPTEFREVPGTQPAKQVYQATHGPSFIPGETIAFLFYGPNGQATCVSDTGTLLTYINHSGTIGTPYSYFGALSWMFAVPNGAPSAYPNGTAQHLAPTNPFVSIPFHVDDIVTFTGGYGNYAEGKIVSITSTVIKFQITSGFPQIYDKVVCPLTSAQTVLISAITPVTAEGTSVHSKILSNIYSVNLGSLSLSDVALNEIYDEISPLGALGNVLMKILQDLLVSFDDWDTELGNIPYGPIWMGNPTYVGDKDTNTNWSVGEEIYLDNQIVMNLSKTFYGNDGPDDIAIITRNT